MRATGFGYPNEMADSASPTSPKADENASPDVEAIGPADGTTVGKTDGEPDVAAVGPKAESEPKSKSNTTALEAAGAEIKKRSDGLIAEVHLRQNPATDAMAEELSQMSKLVKLTINNSEMSLEGWWNLRSEDGEHHPSEADIKKTSVFFGLKFSKLDLLG